MGSVAVVVSVLATLVVNGLANALPINGQTTGEISNRFDVYFTPANYVFVIWGLIYLGLVAFAVYQALPAQRQNLRLHRSRDWFAMSGLANIAWILLWHYELFPLTLVAMVALLGLLIATYLRLGVGRESVPLGERLLVHLPVSIYLGWISVATIANAAVVFVVLGWGGLGIDPEVWTVFMVAVALTIGWILALARSDFAFSMVLVWALAGIGVRNVSVAVVGNASWVAAGLAALAAAVAVRRSVGDRTGVRSD